MRRFSWKICSAELGFVLCLLAAALSAAAQSADSAKPADPDQPATTPPPLKQTIIVTGTWQPVPLEESDRAVNAYQLRDRVLLFGDLASVLDLDSSVQVQPRAPGGVQADISIRGGSPGQTLVLLNGIRLSDAQSAHHTFDIPVPRDAIDHIEVLRGSGSTLYGSEAVGGVVNVITKPGEFSAPPELLMRGGYGSFGTNEQSGLLSFAIGPISQRFSLDRALSTGFRDDREYRNLTAASETWLRSNLGLTRAFLSLLDRPFGADQFYGNYNSWERTKTWLATLSQDLGKKTIFTLAYRRHTDLFELLRDNPGFYTNRHEDETWDVAIRRQDSLSKYMRIFYGAQLLADHVDSTNLGIHSRKQTALYGDLDFRGTRRFSASIGVREQFYGSADHIFVPALNAGYWLSSRMKARGGASRTFRLPNYTDLYYHDPANIGNPNLKPERSWTYEGGLDLYVSTRLKGSFTLFSRHDKDDIDYIRANNSSIWQALNFDSLTFTGWEAALALSLPRSQSLEVQYTGLHGAASILNGYQSKYVFNYPSQQAIFSWQKVSNHGWLARVRTGITNQYQRNTYVLVDADAAWTRSRFHPYLRLSNLTNADYQPVVGVVMPGRSALVGLEVCLLCRKD